MPRKKTKPSEDQEFHEVPKPQKEKGIKLNKEQQQALETINAFDVTFIEGKWGCGKTMLAVYAAIQHLKRGFCEKIVVTRPFIADKGLGALPGPQTLDSKILTPNGWVRMGDIKIGDIVYAYDGTPVEVLQTHEFEPVDIYELTTNRGQKTKVSGDHLWCARERNYKRKINKQKVYTTDYIRENILNKYGELRFQLPDNHTIPFDHQELPIHPYIMGCMLGDGSIGDIDNTPSFHNIDNDIIERFSLLLEDMGLVTKIIKPCQISICQKNESGKVARKIRLSSDKEVIEFDRMKSACSALQICKNKLYYYCTNNKTVNGITYSFVDKEISFNHKLKEEFFKLGLTGKRAWDKFIPEIYKFTSIDQRIELLRGLLDTDGTIKKNGEIGYTTTSKKLAQDITEIIRSLGGKATIYTRDRVGKVSKINNRNVVSRRVSYEVTINIDYNVFYCKRKSERFKPNRKKHHTLINSIVKVGKEPVKCITINHSSSLYITDDYIITHNSAAEKINFEMQPILDNFYELIGQNETEKLISDGIIKLQYSGKVKGITVQDAIFLCDETQDNTWQDFIRLLTRLGSRSKMICTLSKEQIHDFIGDDSCYYDLLWLKDSGLVGWSQLIQNHRHGLINQIIDFVEEKRNGD